MNETKVYVDPACNINYSSFYLVGLRQLFGGGNVKFANKPFKDLVFSNHTHFFCFVINDKKYVIDFQDRNTVYVETFLEWADIYGKVNYKEDFVPQKWSYKVVRVGANFAIPYFGNSRIKANLLFLSRFFTCWRRVKNGYWRALRGSYISLSMRKTEPYVKKSDNVADTIFFATRYWLGQDACNEYRAMFIKVCKDLSQKGFLKFMGGFVPENVEAKAMCPEDLLIDDIPYDEYVNGLNRSFMVFNTPAYHQCHGWKLPEYLSQGKVILSTPFVNELPFPLEHKKNIYVVDPNEESMREAILTLKNDAALRKRLSRGALEYWEEHACPMACIKHFLSF